jgi:hypothetical protein
MLPFMSLRLPLIALLFCLPSLAQETSPPSGTPTAGTAPSLERIIAAATQMPAWRSARHQVERLTILRDKALAQKDRSDPISDRYVITLHGGPVDLVRFFGLARIVCGGMDRRAALLKEYQREKGEVCPDDLPSNALGALFGEELRPHMRDTGHDLLPDLRKFFAALQPADDATVKSHGFQRLIDGLGAENTEEQRAASRSWRTAEPLCLAPVLAPSLTATLTSGETALHAAGLETRRIQGLPIVIERIGTPEPEPKPTRAVPVKEAPAPKPKPMRVPKAVAVPE